MGSRLGLLTFFAVSTASGGNYGNVALSFEPNLGQTSPQVRFLARATGMTVFVTDTESVMVLVRGEKRAVVRMKYLGARAPRRVRGIERLPGITNYFIGCDSKKWRTNIPNYAKAALEGAYPGVDLVFRGNERRLEYDFVVAPGARPDLIELAYESGGTVAIDPNGDLLLTTSLGVLRQQKPLVYQEVDGRRVEIAGGYKVQGRRVGFTLARYDTSRTLVIDPVLAYSTFLGGSGGDFGYGIAVDGTGSAYVTGYTASIDFPTQSPYNGTPTGGTSVFVTKLAASGNALVYSTYLGGGSDQEGNAIAVDSAGSAYVTGWTDSADFPIQSAYQGILRGAANAFVAKLAPAGNALVYSTYLGGSSEDSGWAIAVASGGTAYVAGDTSSADFPTLAPFQSALNGTSDAFVAKLAPAGNALVYSTYLGGSSDDFGAGIAVDAAGAAYVTGDTSSSDFPIQSAFQATLKGPNTAFVTKLAPAGNALMYSTYLGGTSFDVGEGIAVDAAGSAYVTGWTDSSNFPIQSAYQATFKGSEDAFVTKLAPAGNALIYSTYLGGSASQTALGIAVDSTGSAFVTGYTYSADFPTLSPYQSYKAGQDAFVARLASAGNALVFSTYLGGSLDEEGLGITVDGAGSAYVTGFTESPDFPTHAPFQATLRGSSTAFVTKLATPATALVFVPVTPCRVADTRGNGKTGAFGPPSIGGGSSRDFPIPSSGCGIPTSAQAYSLNVTVTPPGPLAYLSIWPSGQPQPVVSTLNSFTGRVVANAALVPAGANGAISVYVSDTTDVIVDINGYFVPSGVVSGALAFYPATPCRVADTRDLTKPAGFGPPSLAAGATRNFAIPQSPCGIPSSAQAYSLNFTAVPPGPLTYLSTWPAGQAQPVVSTLNSFDGKVVANAAIVPAGSSGAISVFASNATDVVIDINGYFAVPGGSGALSFYAATPCRAADTRGNGFTGPFGPPTLSGNATRTFPLPSSSCGIPTAAQAYSLNMTVVPPGPLTYLTTWPTGQPQPVVSTLNSFDGRVVANAAIVPAGSAGSTSVYVSNPTDLIIDVNGYFAP